MPQSAKGGHQIGLALHNYHDTHSVFPPGQVWMTGGDCYSAGSGNDCRSGASWMTLILPFMDETSLYNAYNADCHNYGAGRTSANTTVTRSVLYQYCCPSDKEPTLSYTDFRQASYAGNSGTYGAVGSGNYLVDVPKTLGPLFGGSKVRIRDIYDGTSQTMAAGETFDMAGSVDRGAWAFAYDRFTLRTTCWPVNAYALHAADHFCPGHDSSVAWRGAWAFASRHEGGGFFLMCDGQVRFISENIDLRVYKALSTIDNNEVVDDEDF